MSEATFGLTGVDVDASKQKGQQKPQQLQKNELVIKKNEEKKDQDLQKSQNKLPILGEQKQQKNNQILQQQQQVQQQQKLQRAKTSIHANKILQLKQFIDVERQKEDKEKIQQKSQKKTIDVSLQKRWEQEQEFKKKKKKQIIDTYKSKIVTDFDNLYSNQDKYETVIEQLKQLEKKIKLQGEIQRNEQMLIQDQKNYNKIKYTIQQKQKELDAIKNQIQNCTIVFTTEEERQQLTVLEELYQEYLQKLDDEQVIQMSLQHMKETRKKLLLYEKKQSEILYEEYAKNKHKLHQFEEKNIEYRQKQDDINKQISHYQKIGFKLPMKFQELLEDELSEFEDKRALKEIFKHENKRKEELLQQELQQKKQELKNLQEEKEKQHNKIKQEKIKVEKILNQKRQNMEGLLKVSCVSEINQLEKHKKFMEESNQDLEQFRQYYQNQIDSYQQDIQKSKQELEILKYIDKLNNSIGQENISNNEQQNSPIDNKNIEKYEQILIEEQDRLQDKEFQVKKLEKIIDQICLVTSRVSYQLQPKNMKSKNIEVKREDLVDQITLCGLKLEKIIAFLAKKKESLRVESINTDADNFAPPDYVGINPIDYTRPKEIEDLQNFKESVLFEYVENDPNEIKEEDFIKSKREKIKVGIDEGNE